MGTCNFNKQDNFNLYVADTETDDTDLENFFDYYDYLAFEYDFKLALNEFFYKPEENKKLIQHCDIELMSGYYSGIQLYVRENDWIELNKTEIKKVNKALKKIAKRLGMFEIAVVARFSNGETFYKKVLRKERTQTGI